MKVIPDVVLTALFFQLFSVPKHISPAEALPVPWAELSHIYASEAVEVRAAGSGQGVEITGSGFEGSVLVSASGYGSGSGEIVGESNLWINSGEGSGGEAETANGEPPEENGVGGGEAGGGEEESGSTISGEGEKAAIGMNSGEEGGNVDENGQEHNGSGGVVGEGEMLSGEGSGTDNCSQENGEGSTSDIISGEESGTVIKNCQELNASGKGDLSGEGSEMEGSSQGGEREGSAVNSSSGEENGNVESGSGVIAVGNGIFLGGGVLRTSSPMFGEGPTAEIQENIASILQLLKDLQEFLPD